MGVIVLVPFLFVIVAMFVVSVHEWIYHPDRRSYGSAFWIALPPLLSIGLSFVFFMEDFDQFQARRDFGTVREISSVAEYLESEPGTSAFDECRRAESRLVDLPALPEAPGGPSRFEAAVVDADRFAAAGWSVDRYVDAPPEAWDLPSTQVYPLGWGFAATRDDVSVSFLAGRFSRYGLATGCSSFPSVNAERDDLVLVSEFPSLDSLPVGQTPSIELADAPLEVSLGVPGFDLRVSSVLRQAYPPTEAELCVVRRVEQAGGLTFGQELPAIADALDSAGWAVTRLEVFDDPTAVQAEMDGEYITAWGRAILLYPVGCGGPVEYLPTSEAPADAANVPVIVEEFGEND